MSESEQKIQKQENQKNQQDQQDQQEHSAYVNQVVTCARTISDIFDDLGSGIVGFIPNGLDVIYNDILKMLPFIGEIFCVPFVETILKLFMGITVGQGIARDLGRFVFRPLGFMLGALLGATIKKVPSYNRGIGPLLYDLSGQTVIGALVGFGVLLSTIQFTDLLTKSAFNLEMITISLLIGAFVGLMAKAMFLLSLNMVSKANAANMKRNVNRAKSLNKKLKEIAKQKAKSKILMYAQDLLLQVNGSESQQQLEAFFSEQYGKISYHTYKKLDRHFDYLTDRACCGDIKALKKMHMLIPNRKRPAPNGVSALDEMLNRIFNGRTLFQLKDDVDNTYDNWRYQGLREGSC
tara:strand:+ start:121404 stop:122453 length:1050 start_codon:yes stop_codon:yes gene_type:complete